MSTSTTITTIDTHDAGKTGTNPMDAGAPAPRPHRQTRWKHRGRVPIFFSRRAPIRILCIEQIRVGKRISQGPDAHARPARGPADRMSRYTTERKPIMFTKRFEYDPEPYENRMCAASAKRVAPSRILLDADGSTIELDAGAAKLVADVLRSGEFHEDELFDEIVLIADADCDLSLSKGTTSVRFHWRRRDRSFSLAIEDCGCALTFAELSFTDARALFDRMVEVATSDSETEAHVELRGASVYPRPYTVEIDLRCDVSFEPVIELTLDSRSEFLAPEDFAEFACELGRVVDFGGAASCDVYSLDAGISIESFSDGSVHVAFGDTAHLTCSGIWLDRYRAAHLARQVDRFVELTAAQVEV